MKELGWRFATPEDKDAPGENVERDPVKGHEKFTHLRDVYFSADPEYKGRFTVPTLFDTKTGQIVNNESSEIIRMFYTEVWLILPIAAKTNKIILERSSMISSLRSIRKWTSSQRL